MDLLSTLNIDEIQRLGRVLKASARYPTGRRNRAMILLALRAGLRASEIVGHEKRNGGGLRVRDVDLSTGELTLRDCKDTRAKGRRAKKTKAGRILYADAETLESLRAYWQDRVALPHGSEDYFFTTRSGNPVPNREYRAAMQRYCQRAGIDPAKAHPHVLRHSYATEAARRMPLHVLKEILGHRSISATSIYLHTSKEDIRKAMLGTNS